MENASKALIIAGAILIAILLISVGILVMNSMNKPIDQATSEGSSMSAQMFNSKFITYFGNKVSARQVRSLLQAVIINNSGKAERSKAITVVFRKIDSSNGSFAPSANSGHLWKPSTLESMCNLILNNKYYNVRNSTGCNLDRQN